MVKINYTKTSNIRNKRLEKGYTYRDMAKKLGYKSPASYMYIEKGVYEPNIKTMNELAKILGEPVQYFFELNV